MKANNAKIGDKDANRYHDKGCGLKVADFSFDEDFKGMFGNRDGCQCRLCYKMPCICVKRTTPIVGGCLSDADIKFNEEFVQQSKGRCASYAVDGWDGLD